MSGAPDDTGRGPAHRGQHRAGPDGCHDPHRQTGVRPVAEFYFDQVFNEERTYSALVGAIWQVSDKLSFDVAARYAIVDGRPISEFRAGLTFGFPLNFGRPMAAETANAAGLRRR